MAVAPEKHGKLKLSISRGAMIPRRCMTHRGGRIAVTTRAMTLPTERSGHSNADDLSPRLTAESFLGQNKKEASLPSRMESSASMPFESDQNPESDQPQKVIKLENNKIRIVESKEELKEIFSTSPPGSMPIIFLLHSIFFYVFVQRIDESAN